MPPERNEARAGVAPWRASGRNVVERDVPEIGSTLRARQARHLAARYGLSATRAQLLAPMAFANGSPA